MRSLRNLPHLRIFLFLAEQVLRKIQVLLSQAWLLPFACVPFSSFAVALVQD